MKPFVVKKVLALAAMAGILGGAIAVTLLLAPSNRERVVFYFHSYDSVRLCTEVRSLPGEPTQGRERMFVEELLLGPMTNRYKRLFNPDTTLEFCLVYGDSLYLGLSGSALRLTSEVTDIEDGVWLLKENVTRKFRNLRSVFVYIDGKEAYAGV